jgi:hypothetical protein
MFTGPATGGFIAAVAWASAPEQFAEKVSAVVRSYSVEIKGVTGIRPLDAVLQEKQIEPSLAHAVSHLRMEDVALGTLFTYQDGEQKN